MDEAKKILVVEDDGEQRRMLREALSAQGWRVVETDGIESGWHLFQSHKPDLAVLDVHLPDGSGRDLCRKIRGHKTLSATPVVMLTGRGELDDRLSGFEAGADQYLVKPVHVRELLAWVQALLRRLTLDKDEGAELRAGDLVIELETHLVRYKDRVVPNLTCKEFDLLAFLVKKRPKVLSRGDILKTLWRTIAVDHVVDTHLSNLRRKLPAEVADRLQSIPGRGFRYFE